jgi:hypothetical protein
MKEMSFDMQVVKVLTEWNDPRDNNSIASPADSLNHLSHEALNPPIISAIRLLKRLIRRSSVPSAS